MLKSLPLILVLVGLAQASRIRRQGFLDLTRSARCRNPSGDEGTCLPIRQCAPLVNLLVTQRQQQEVVTFLRQSVCGYDGLDPKVCCVNKDNTVKSTTTSNILPKNNGQSTTVSSETTPKGTTTKPIVGLGPEPSSSSKLPMGTGCGVSSVQHTRVVGGVNASLGAWPWMAALGYQSSSGGSSPVFLCAGSLITNRHVLTAAHCLANKKKLIVIRLGDLNLYSDSDGAKPIDARAARTIIHEDYNPTTFTNDIAIIELVNPVTLTNNIQPVCLPVSREMRAKDFVNRAPFIAGWGSVSFAGPSSATLLELQIPVVPEAQCKKAFETFKTAVIDRRVVCAGLLRGGKDACRGDSGGPLMDYNKDDKLFYQIGVVSYGYKCAEPGFPGIYTRTTSFADWIIKKIENKLK